MTVYFGADHRGFNLKEILKKITESWGYTVVDLGNKHYDEEDDYADFAGRVGQKVSLDHHGGRGVVICGSGAGADITVNKFSKVRSVLGISEEQVKSARADDDVNVLSLAASFTRDEDAKKMLAVFLKTDFKGEARHLRRLNKINQIEKGHFNF